MNLADIINPAPWNPLDLVVPAALLALVLALHLIGRSRDRRMPRYEGQPEPGRPLTVREWRAYEAIRSAERRRQPYAPEPQRRRQP